MLDEIQLLRNQILSCQQVFYYTMLSVFRVSAVLLCAVMLSVVQYVYAQGCHSEYHFDQSLRWMLCYHHNAECHFAQCHNARCAQYRPSLSNCKFVELIIRLIVGGLPSSQTVGSLLRTPWQAKLARKIIWT